MPAAQTGVRKLLAPVWHDRGWKGKTGIVVVVVLIALTALGAALDDNSTTASSESDIVPSEERTEVDLPRKKEPDPPRGYRDLFVEGMTTKRAARRLCARYGVTISNWSELAQRRLAASRGADADSYAAAGFQSEVSWLARDHAGGFEGAIYRASRARLRAVTRHGLTSEMVDRFSIDALSSCNWRAEYNRASSALTDLDARTSDILQLAADRPWYPRGFDEWDDNVAWHWVDDPSCDYFRCSQIVVLTRSGCPSGLYAEANFKSGSTVVDYGNDSLGSLGAGESAVLTLTSTSEFSDLRTHMTEINCY